MKFKCEICNSEEFITKPNQYDVYKLVDGKLVFQNSELVNEKVTLFCRECSEKMEFEEKELAI